MARIRTIKPDFPQSESMGRVSRDARLCFVEMWTIADDSGRLRGNSRMLASLLFPYDDDAPGLIDGWMSELEGEGCIIRYQVDGAHFVEISNWLKHQKIDKPSASKIPPFGEASRIVAKPREPSSLEGIGKEEDRKEESFSSDKSSEKAADAASDKPLFDFGKSVLGRNSGGQIQRLRKKYPDGEVMRLLEVAATKSDPREYVGAIVRGDPAVTASIFAAQQREEYRRMGVDLD